MKPESQGALFSPTDFVQPGRRLFIDTNIFMDTNPRYAGGLKGLFDRSKTDIVRHENPIVIPTKVVDELTKQSRLSPSGLSEDRAAAVKKAANALTFLGSVEPLGLVRKDLGDDSNPYTDDLFIELFTRMGSRYEMCLLTHDITLRLRVRLLAATTGHRLVAGVVNNEGMIEVDADQELYERGMRKLDKMRRQAAEGVDVAKAEREVRALEPLLDNFQRVLRTAPPAPRGTARRVATTAQTATAAVPEPRPFSKSPRFRGPDRRFGDIEIPTEGQKVHFTTNAGSGPGAVTLGKLLGEGGEGRVYELIGLPNYVAKIFDSEHRTTHRQEKLTLLMSRGLVREGIGFPVAVLTSTDDHFVGYAMPRAAGKELQSTVMRPKRFKMTYPNWTKADLVDVCISFLEKVAYLHSLNILLGDINPKNLMVDETKAVWIIDADSWQLDGYPCPVGTPMFTSPTVTGDYADRLRTRQDELFAVATMLFMILITGQFPYSRAGTDGDIQQLIKEGKFAFQFGPSSDRDQPEGNWKFMWSHLPFPVKSLFWNTFHRDGKRYGRRPSAEEWLQIFREYRLFFGSADDFDPMSSDVYPFRFRAFRHDTPIRDCPQCSRRHAIVGQWDDEDQSYYVPTLCFDCNQQQQGKQRQQVRVVAQPQQAACKSCGRSVDRSSMTYGRCPDCTTKAKQLDPARLCVDCRQPFITFDHIDWFRGKGLDIPRSHVAIKRACPPKATVPTKPRTSARTTTKPSTPAKKSLWTRFVEWLNS